MTERFDERLAAALTPPGLPDGDDAWPGIRTALAARARRLRAVRAALVAVALLVLTGTAVVAGSPDVRARLADAVSIGGGPTGLRSLSPAPGFTVLQPGYLPDGMRLLGNAYRAPGSGLTAIGGAAYRKDDPAGQALVEEAAVRLRRLQGEQPGPALVLLYGGPADRWVELVQRSAAGAALPAGEPTRVRGAPAVRVRRDGRELAAWVEGDTYLEFHSTLGDDELGRVLDGLRPQPLEIATPVPRPLVVTMVPPPLPRARTVERPAVDRAALEGRCGVWNGDAPHGKPGAASEQALCRGLAVLGLLRPSGAYGLDRRTWRETAGQHGLEATPGPDPSADVWVLQTSDQDGTGALVVLDAANGDPRVLVRLRPTHPPPLAGWVAATERPGLDRRLAAALRCGAWDAEAPYPAAVAAVRCRASALAGGPERWVEAQRLNWAQAAHELGVAREPGPAPDAPVWFAASETEVVVLDAASGEAVVLARLRAPA